MISSAELLSKGCQPPVHPALSGKGGVQRHLEPEDQSKPQRRERKPQLQPNGRSVVVSNKPREGFKPSAEMLDIHKDIEKARLRVARTYDRLMFTGNGTPNFLSLKRFRELVRKVTLLENKYRDLEVVVRKAHQDKREAEIKKSRKQEESTVQPLKISLRNISDSVEKAKDALAEGVIKLDEFRDLMKVLDSDSLKASTDALVAGTISVDKYRDIKAMAKSDPNTNGHKFSWLEQSNRIGLARLAVRCSKLAEPIEMAADTLAEGDITVEEFYALKRRFSSPPKPLGERVFRTRQTVAPPKDDGKKNKKKKKMEQGGR